MVLHTDFSMAIAWLALLILVLISWSQSPDVDTLVPKLVPKLVNSSVF